MAFWLLIAAGAWAYWFFNHKQNKELSEQIERQKEKHTEQTRLEECYSLVHWVAEHLGYVAKDLIEREELEERIENGISADQLGEFIGDRIYDFDALVLGEHRGVGVPVKVKQAFRDRHFYIIGKSGSGKTNLLRQLITQDMNSPDQIGLAVLAPEQEMITEELLPFVPEDRIDDVVYFNPADTSFPIAFNPMHLEEGEDLDERVDENMTIFARLLGEDSSPRINEIFRQTFYALLPIPETTLLDVPRLLDRENPHFRNFVLGELTDTDTIDFWKTTYKQLPKNVHLPIVYRLSRFTKPKTIRNVLCQTEQKITFRDMMDTGKICFFNLSDGVLGEQNSQVLGQFIVSKFQLATMSRADTRQKDRKRFVLYIDEFAAFVNTAGASYEKILSRARKYRLALVLAHQQTGQIPNRLLREIMGNVSTMISFVVSREDARRIAPEFISTSGGEVVNTHSDELVSLKVGQAYARIGNTSFPMRTHLFTHKPDWDIKERCILRSREQWGIAQEGNRKSGQKEEVESGQFNLQDLDDDL